MSYPSADDGPSDQENADRWLQIARDKIREQAALLRECREVLSDQARRCPGCNGREILTTVMARFPTKCEWCASVRALLLRLTASDSESEEKRARPIREVIPNAPQRQEEIDRLTGKRMGAEEETQRVLVLGHEPVVVGGGKCIKLVIHGFSREGQPAERLCGEPPAAHYAPSPTQDTARGQRAEGGGE